VPGRADRSYGIQVARLAGLPVAVVARAREILTGLERDELSRGGRPSLSGAPAPQSQLGLFAAHAPQDDPLRQRLREIDINHLTPMQGLTLLADLQKEAGE
jgi:DNA mismatch repair protein MutS